MVNSLRSCVSDAWNYDEGACVINTEIAFPLNLLLSIVELYCIVWIKTTEI